MDPAERRARVVTERLGTRRAGELAAELAGHELVVLDRAELADLERQSAGYRRLVALVEQPDA